MSAASMMNVYGRCSATLTIHIIESDRRCDGERSTPRASRGSLWEVRLETR
jgi:hypothetical protein